MNRKRILRDQSSLTPLILEGLDFKVLQSNDWNMYRPRYVLVECLSSNYTSIMNDPIALFLIEKKYELVAKTHNTIFFREG